MPTQTKKFHDFIETLNLKDKTKIALKKYNIKRVSHLNGIMYLCINKQDENENSQISKIYSILEDVLCFWGYESYLFDIKINHDHALPNQRGKHNGRIKSRKTKIRR